MPYYLAADGGGTKLNLLLYNEALHPIKIASGGGTNNFFKPDSLICSELDALFSDFFPSDCTQLEAVDVSIVGDVNLLRSKIEQHCGIRSFRSITEGQAALAAAGALFGMVAQSGTGSDIFYECPNGLRDVVGGYGALLGDEGSGYDIGLNALKGAMYAADGRGPETLLHAAIYETLQVKSNWEIVRLLTGNPDYRRIIAGLSRTAGAAARAGDAVAGTIFADAGHQMALQGRAMLKRYPDFCGSIVVSGGAWKGSPLMFKCFREEILQIRPDVTVSPTRFEPVIGCLIFRLLSEGRSFADYEPLLTAQYGSFQYKIT